MSVCDLAPGYIRAIAPYQPGKPTSELARELGLEESGIVKLASNENPLGVSPKALAAVRSLLDGLARYPDGNGFELKQALSRRCGVGQDQIVLGNGSNLLVPDEGLVLNPWPTPKRSVSAGTTFTSSGGTPSSVPTISAYSRSRPSASVVRLSTIFPVGCTRRKTAR